MKLLLDTDRLSDALAEVADVIDTLEAAETMQVPVIALGEIRSGFARGRRLRAMLISRRSQGSLASERRFSDRVAGSAAAFDPCALPASAYWRQVCAPSGQCTTWATVR